MNTPSSPPSKNIPGADNGSAVFGFFIGWGVLIISILITLKLPQKSPSLFIILPMFNTLLASLWFKRKCKRKTANGISAASLSLLVIALLLVAGSLGMFQ